MLLKLTSKFMKGLLTKIAVKSIEKTMGVRLNLNIDGLELDGDDAQLHFTAVISGSINNEDLEALVMKALE